MSRERQIQDQELSITIVVTMANQQNNLHGALGNTDHHDPPGNWDDNIKAVWFLAGQQSNQTPAFGQVLEQWNQSQRENQERLQEAEARWQQQAEALEALRTQQDNNTTTQQRPPAETTTPSQEVATQPGTAKPYLKSSDIRKPPKYGGQVANNAARRWLRAVEEYFEAEHTLAGKNPSDVQRIYYTKDFLDGTARTMWRAREERVREKEVEPIDTWERFRQWITDNFKEFFNKDKK